ncbi:MAG: asparagine synthase (glutamine-hydrolyzing) [Lachnospiraceae bacterium]|nr:asparagine synthase (glutamine-hydrolyzing) [Lachnospiraceae bacterium]
MCGINGILAKKEIHGAENRIANMNKALVHRGPDAGNYLVIDKRIALGHRRLSIIDVHERSNQPMISASGRWSLIYNGEIYNYTELKNQLSDYPFQTTSDTEVLLAYLDKFGVEAALKASNGMFGFAVYDKQEQVLYLCRDRLGIKPLFFIRGNENFVFSSEIKGILNSGLVKAKLNCSAIDDYLGYRYVREPYTFFEDIFQVESGTYIKVSQNLEIEKIRYWDIPADFNMQEVYDEVEKKQAFHEKLLEAVTKRMVADVPLGTYLSGGIDSSLLSAIVVQKSSTRVNTYTIGFPELNEFSYAKMVAEIYHTAHHEIVIEQQDYWNHMKELIMYRDAPVGVPNEIPLALMSKELKKEITVVLSGEGADELLGGYGRIFRAPFAYENENNEKTFYGYLTDKYEYVPRWLRDSVLSKEENYREEFDRDIEKIFKEHCNEYNMFYFFHKYHVKGLLQRVDTTTMYASVEARVPFLDHELVEFCYREIPYDMKLRWKDTKARESAKSMDVNAYSENLDFPKYILRQVAYDYLPQEVIERKKVGFPVPIHQWEKNLTSMIKEKLQNASWLKADAVEELLCAHQEKRISSQILWMFLSVQIFVESYFEREWMY